MGQRGRYFLYELAPRPKKKIQATEREQLASRKKEREMMLSIHKAGVTNELIAQAGRVPIAAVEKIRANT